MNLKNIKNSTKESIIQNFMENVKYVRRGPSHQRPKSWGKGTKSGSEKRKMREEGKREARELNENRDWLSAAHDAFSGYLSPAQVTKHFKDKSFSSVEDFKSAVEQLADDHADRFISTQDREGKNPEAAMRAWSAKVVNRFENKLANQEKLQEQLNEEFHTAHQRSAKHESLTHDAATFLSGRLGVPYENLRRQLDKHPQAPFTSGVILDALKQLAGEHHTDLVAHLSPTIERFKGVSDRSLWHPAGTVMLAGPNWGETPSQGDIHDFVILSPKEAKNTDAIHDARGDGYRVVPLPGVEQERSYGRGGGFRGYRSGDLTENSYYEKLKTRLQEQSPMGWHEGDPELESDVLAKHTASLSPEERDPFHLIDEEDREDIHKTLEKDNGTHLVRAGLLGRIQTIARMAQETSNNLNAMKRISQLIDYGNKAIDEHHHNRFLSIGKVTDGRDIPI